MVWIHGGAFNIGSGCLFDAAELSRRGNVVVVTVNYRLGALGFSYLDHLDERFAGSGNVALLDQIAALEWVRDNIAAFGGDADNVTIFGESAGGHSVGCLLTVPDARGLFHRAIAQSGAASTCARSTRRSRRPPRSWTSSASRASKRSRRFRSTAWSTRRPAFSFSPVQDGVVLADHVIDAVAVGNCADVPLLISHTRDEMRLFAANGRALGELPADRRRARGSSRTCVRRRSAPRPPRTAPPNPTRRLRSSGSRTSPTPRFHMPDFGLAEARLIRSPAVWMARFSWPSTAMDGQLGACHAIEIPFLFTGGGNLGGMTPEDGPPEHLAHAIQDAWVAFARNGDPNTSALPEWPRYSIEHRLVMELDDECTLIEDPDGDIRRLWPATANV